MSEKKPKSIGKKKYNHNYISIRIDEQMEEILKQYAHRERRSVPIFGGMLLEQALSALKIEQGSNFTTA